MIETDRKKTIRQEEKYIDNQTNEYEQTNGQEKEKKMSNMTQKYLGKVRWRL